MSTQQISQAQAPAHTRIDAGHKPLTLSPESVQAFKDWGFLVVENALSAAEVQGLQDEAARICRNDFSTREAKADEAASELSDVEVQKKYLCIHFPHKASELLKASLAHPSVVEVLKKVVAPDVKAVQSMLFIKASGKPGQAWHQDEDYLATRDRSLIGAWISMDKATVENGCLWVIPGSHKSGILWQQKWHGDKRFDCSEVSVDFPYTDADAIPVEVPAGSIVFFNGYLLHRSLPNVAKEGFRRALVNHYCSAQSHLVWEPRKPEMNLAKVDIRDYDMVCGTDPYAWKGKEEIHFPHVRPAGEGGCGPTRVYKEMGG